MILFIIAGVLFIASLTATFASLFFWRHVVVVNGCRLAPPKDFLLAIERYQGEQREAEALYYLDFIDVRHRRLFSFSQKTTWWEVTSFFAGWGLLGFALHFRTEDLLLLSYGLVPVAYFLARYLLVARSTFYKRNYLTYHTVQLPT